ncbi:TonB-dependent receptor [Catenovulum maritimum]|uniref:TonB-dependent receptor n=1 Tax=Catenovulum maritimum TaxID=1513271 RepID=A0A0J8GRY6_9ALTE|nr:TonB-dependent receptor [Catenovulum maritimum]KMT64054.1 hypothetical protein XM47_16460 [Catenovulum maritimum]
MFKRKSLAEQIRLHLLASATVLAPISLQNVYAAEEQAEDTEVIEVTGVRNALKEANFLKKNASQIMDAISSEDIGKLPDTNVAEALQRITGVQIFRNETGDGAGFQVRGISQNRVEVNGRSMVSNGDGNRSNAFDSTSSALFKGIEVIKSPMADTTEGALGAVIRLKTFKPLDFKNSHTFSGQYQYLDSTNNDKGVIGTALAAGKWEVNDGLFGALINVSYEDRDITTNRFGAEWGLPNNRPNVQCGAGSGNTAVGVFDPAISEPSLEHPCAYLAQGTINHADGSVSSGVDYPVSDLRYGLDENGNPRSVQSVEPRLAYSIYHPDNFVFERKPFNNKKSGLDVNLQWSPNEDLEFYLQATYQKFEQFRPQTKIVIPAGGGGNNSRLADGFVIQEFERAPSGNEYSVCADQSQAAAGQTLYCPEQNNVVRGVLVAGRLQSDAVRFANNNQNSEQTQKTIATGFKWLAQDWEVTADLNISQAKQYTDGLNLSMNFSVSPDSYWDFRDNRFDIPTVGIIGSDTFYDSASDTCFSQVLADPDVIDSKFIKGEVDPTCGTDILSYENFSFGGFNGEESWFGNEETEFKLDADRYLDISLFDGAFNFTMFEMGARFTTAKFWRKQNQIKRIDDPNANPNVNLNVDPIVGDSNRDGIAGGDAINKFIEMEEFEPSFVIDGVAPTPDFLTDYTASTLFPRSWLTPVFGEQYNLWFDRLTGHAFWRENIGNQYQVNEDSQAAYLKLNFEGEIGSVAYTGNFGARYINYDYEIESRNLNFDPQTAQPITEPVEIVSLDGITETVSLSTYSLNVEERSIDKILPSANVSFAFTDKLFLRTAFATAISMPNPVDLAETAPVPQNTDEDVLNYRTGNADLLPYEASQFDVSLEWYFSDTGLLSAALFKKDISRFITRVSRIRKPGPEDGLGEAIENSNTLLKENRPINTSGGTIEGFEFTYRTTFDFLQGWQSGFGTEFNYTYINSSQDSGSNELTGEALPVQDQSENSYNFVGFYEKYGFSARIAYNYRDRSYKTIKSIDPDRGGYLSLTEVEGQSDPYIEVYSNNAPEFERARGQVDVSLNYQINKHYSLFAQASNITKEPIEKFVALPGMTSSFLDVGASYKAGIRISFK